MGYDERQQSSSSGVLVAVVVAVLIVAVLGIVVGGAALFWVRAAKVEEMVAQERAVAELRRVGAEAHLADAEAQREVEEARAEATPDPKLNFVVTLDREGNTSVDGERIGLDELRTQLAKLKDETSNAFSVRINADPECPAKHVVTVLDVCEEVGDIDFRIVSSEGSDVPTGESDAENQQSRRVSTHAETS